METADIESVQVKELSGRKKKKLYNKLRLQMEFYFSDSNLAKDKFLYNLILQNPDGFVELEVFKTFNKIKGMTEDIDFIASSLLKSTILELSEDKTKVRRKSPIDVSKDFDACTLYVEGLPPYADQKWIKNMFEKFGTMEYVTIPRFNVSQRIKGFSFIEFTSSDSVVNACQYFKNYRKGNTSEEEEMNIDQGKHPKFSKRIRTDSNSEEHLKKKKGEKIDSDVDKLSVSEASDSEKRHEVLSRKRKRKLEGEEKNDEELCKKRKFSAENVITDDNIKKNVDLPRPKNNELLKTESMETEVSQNNSAEVSKESESTKTKKKKHSKKKRDPHERPILRVMPKTEWKAYRNKYLDLQRSTMSFLKKQILLDTQVMKEECKKEESQKRPFIKREENFKEEIPKGAPQFQKGVILKLKLKKPVENSAKVKEQLKGLCSVAYIDVSLGSDEVYLRCYNPDEALFIKYDMKFENMGELFTLTGAEETQYWEKIKSDREAKLNMPVIRKRRGRDKLIAKANKLLEHQNKHIYFE